VARVGKSLGWRPADTVRRVPLTCFGKRTPKALDHDSVERRPLEKSDITPSDGDPVGFAIGFVVQWVIA